MLLAVYIELTWEVWRALYRLQLLSAIASSNSYALVIGFPEGDPGLMWGNTGIRGLYWDFATNFCPCGGGNVGTFIFEYPTLGKNVGLCFCSTERR